jgi:large subunit ribosomal protein L4
VRKSALCSALSLRAKEENIFILEDLALEKVGTKGLKSVFDQFELKKALVVDFDNSNLRLSCRNLADFQLLPPVGVNVYDLLRFDQLVLTRKAAEALQTRLDPSA